MKNLIIADGTRYGYEYFILEFQSGVSFDGLVSKHLDNFHYAGDHEHMEAEQFFYDNERIELLYFNSRVEFEKKLKELISVS